jgi:heptosyltransferase I
VNPEAPAQVREYRPNPEGIHRLLIVRLGSMGDVIHTLPAAAALRNCFPEAMMGWVIEERWTELLCTLPTPRSGPRSPGRPLVDRIHAVNTRTWRCSLFSVQTWEQIAASLSDIRAAQYQIAMDLQGALRSALVAGWSGAPIVYGAAQPRENVASMFYTRKVITSGTHIIEQNLSIAEALTGFPRPTAQIELPYDPAAEQECTRQLGEPRLHNFVLINPGAGWAAKQWPAERYGAIAKLFSECGLKTLVNYGPGEHDLARAVEASSCGAAQPISPSLTQLISLTRRARLFIGGDCGPLHLAAALRIPVVGIFGPTNPARNGPYGTRSIVLRSPASSTSHKRRSRPDDGLLEISPEQVLNAARELLGTCHG